MHEDARDGWAQFVEMVGLHKFYFEHLIKAAGFSMGILGGFVAFAATHQLQDGVLNAALALPLLLAVATMLVFVLAVPRTLDFLRQVEHARHTLGLAWRPHVEILVWMSYVFAFLFACISAGLAGVMLKVLPWVQPG